VAGTYLFCGAIYITPETGNTFNTDGSGGTAFAKNGTTLNSAFQFADLGNQTGYGQGLDTTVMVKMNGSTDYMELFGFADMTGTSTQTCKFTGSNIAGEGKYNAGAAWMACIRVGP